MKSLYILLLFVAGGLAGVAAQAVGKSTVAKIDPKVDQGTWDGWGVSLAWWARVFGERDDLADALFTGKTVEISGRNIPGLDLNIARYNAGASSWNEIDGRKMVKSKIILPYRQMEGFWLDGKDPDPDSSGWDWSVDANQREMLLKAKERGVNHFELFSNSPMWWMTKNDNPSGGPTPKDDNLAREHERNFAIYLANIARRSKDDWGVEFTTVSPFNEPVSNWWFENSKQEGTHMSPPVQERVLAHLRKELDVRGLKDLRIAASDETYYDHAVATWRSYSEETRALVDQVNVHGYQREKGNRKRLQRLVSEAGKVLWNSEYGDGHATGLMMARNLHRDMADLRPQAWVYWQAVDNGGWGLLSRNMRKGTGITVNPKWYVLAQYTRHIRPGSTILVTGNEDIVAAYRPEAGRLAVVFLNDSEEQRDFKLDLSAFDKADFTSAENWLTAPEEEILYEKQDPVGVSGMELEFKLPAKSVRTFVLE